jgi:cytoskeleton protein RodZ
MPALGDEFRVSREARGLSLSDVAEHIHIRATYLQAIEEEDWSAIGAPVYIRGFIRTYARFLGIDPEHVVEAFNQAVPSPPPTKQYATPPVSTAEAGPRPSVWIWIASAIALALVVYVGYGYYQLKTGAPAPRATPLAAVAGPTGATPSATPQASPTPAPTPTRKAVSVRLTEISWLRVNVDGNVILEGEFPPGTVRDFHGKHIHLLVGNAGGVEVAAPGQPAKVLGSPGEVVERDYILTPAKQ